MDKNPKTLAQRIRMRWRRAAEYTALYEDGTEVPITHPESVITDGLIGIYRDGVTVAQLEDDLQDLSS